MKDSPYTNHVCQTEQNHRQTMRYGVPAYMGVIVIMAWILPAVLEGETTNVFAPTVSYQHLTGTIASPTVSYQHLAGAIVSPTISFNYSEGIGFSQDVSYYYQFVVDSIGDGIPDLWRALYFGGYGTTTNNLSCATSDADGTGQNNLFKYVAGLNPTNPASVFTLNIVPDMGQPNREDLVFSPRLDGRTYTVLFTTNLLAGDFVPVSCCATNDASTHRTVTDLQATNSCRFYRVMISNP